MLIVTDKIYEIVQITLNLHFSNIVLQGFAQYERIKTKALYIHRNIEKIEVRSYF